MKPPIFLLSPARSYSTVSIALLSGHPDIFGFPELLMFTGDTLDEVLARKRSESDRSEEIRVNGIFRAIAQINEGSQGRDEIARAQVWLKERRHWSPASVMKYLFDRVDPQIPLEKSPATSSKEGLARCLESFPDARFIHLTRHPVTTQRSMREHWRFEHKGRSVEFRSASCASAWYISHLRILGTLSLLPKDRWIRVRAEDLIQNPHRFAPSIFEWLGLDSSEETIQGITETERWVFASNGESANLYGGDPKFLLNPQLRPVADPGPIVFPPEWNLRGEMCDKMTELAHELGYR
ncbi:sulfotransferase family protein [Streptomyces sp. NPDC048416]|uniref:sulfotransferase family protein n=1 Tax=Streptomyces sp. NPDC048416 TaxID=3365546 RepID=UPI003715244D